jgi:tetratricopeptide (TPR) repeat protein
VLVGLNRRQGFAVLGVCVVAASLAANGLLTPPAGLARETADVETLLAADRYFRPRLSAVADHLPCSEGGSTFGFSCRPNPRPGSPGFIAATRLVRELSAGSLRTNAEARHLAGLALLVIGDPASAAEELLTALRMEPENDRVATDLLAAHLIRFDGEGDPVALFEAFRSVGDSHVEESSYAPLIFNWALLLERTGLTEEAEDAWGRYLAAETHLRWRNEAADRLGQLRVLNLANDWSALRTVMVTGELPRELPTRVLQHVRLLIDDELLGQWAELELQGDPAANRRLRLIRHYAEELASKQRDRLLLDAVEHLQAGSPRVLAEAHRAYTMGRSAHELQQYETAGAHFRRAALAFASERSPFEIWPRFYLAVILHHRPDFAAADRELLALDGDGRLDQYPIARAYIHWMLGLNHTRRADYHRASQSYALARDLFSAAAEWENAAAMDGELGSLAERIASPEEAWRSHYAALAKSNLVLKPRRKQNILIAAGRYFQRQEVSGAARILLGAAVREAERSGSAANLAWSLQERAELWVALGQSAAAEADLRRALRAAREIPDPGLRSDAELDVMLAEAERLRGLQPEVAAELLTRVLALARERRAESRLVRILSARADALLQSGQQSGAIGDLQAALLEIERQRWRLDEPGERRSYLSEARGVLARLVRIEWTAGRFTSALAWVEHFRARVLGESLGLWNEGEESVSVTPQGWEVPRGTNVIAYFLSGGELFTWWLSSGGVRADRRSLDEAEVNSLVADVRRSLQTAGGPPPKAAQALADLLLPARAITGGVARFVFVPDTSLHGLPFAALPHPDGGRLLDHSSVIVAPSIPAFLHLDASPMYRPEDSDFLMISGIRHDAGEFPQLGRLPEIVVGDELRRIPGLRLLSGDAATPAAFLERVRTASVLHFAGHAVAATSDRQAGLVLSPGDDGEGLLDIHEMSAMSANRLRLAILAACGTAAGEESSLDGPHSVVQPFLAAGVRSVVGTLWDIDHATAERFFAAFVAARDEPDPIRAAQLELLKRRPSSGQWAAFQQYGAGPGGSMRGTSPSKGMKSSGRMQTSETAN